MVFVMPVFQVIIFGYAVTTDVKNVSTAIYDQDNSVFRAGRWWTVCPIRLF